MSDPFGLTGTPAPRRPSAVSNALVFGWRAVLKFRHVPEQLFDLVMTPIMFTLLFTFVFGGALAGSTRRVPAVLPPRHPGADGGVQLGLFRHGPLHRPRQGALRPLPHAADLAARAVRRADGGRRPPASDRRRRSSSASGWSSATGRRRASSGVAAGFVLLLAVGFGMGWVFIVLGLLIRTPMTVMTAGFMLLFPLVFASNIMVEPATMPGWLRPSSR